MIGLFVLLFLRRPCCVLEKQERVVALRRDGEHALRGSCREGQYRPLAIERPLQPPRRSSWLLGEAINVMSGKEVYYRALPLDQWKSRRQM